MSQVFKLLMLLTVAPVSVSLTTVNLPGVNQPAIAHNVEVAGEIAGTWHVKPDHNPKAGEPAQVWVALTRQGGKILPFDQANCQMAVYQQPRTEADAPILQPTLKAIAAEQYQGIPGAEVVFPAPGLYNLELSCSPKTEGSFAAFKMQSDVTVASGTALPSPSPSPSLSPSPLNQTEPTTDESTSLSESIGQSMVIGVAIAVVLGLGFLKFLVSRSK